MAISSLVAAESSSVNAKVFQIAEAYTTYEINDTFAAGGYTVTTSPSTSQVQVQFLDASSILSDSTTVSGTVSVSIASDATRLLIKDTSGATNTTVTITYTSTNASGAEISGTLDTLTNTQTYNQTGLLYVLAVGGGGGGACSADNNNNFSAGGGGGAGGVSGGLTFVNTSTSITVGSAGTGSINTQANGNAGGNTSFGNLFSVTGGTGGAAGGISQGSGGGGGGAGGSPGGGTGGLGASQPFGRNSTTGNASTQVFQSVKSGTNGGGGGGGVPGYNRQPSTGSGSGIGTGGTGGYNTAATAGSGFGAGGGGGGNGGGNSIQGADGSPGVVYVLRGF
jgi:hypothetical protein